MKTLTARELKVGDVVDGFTEGFLTIKEIVTFKKNHQILIVSTKENLPNQECHGWAEPTDLFSVVA